MLYLLLKTNYTAFSDEERAFCKDFHRAAALAHFIEEHSELIVCSGWPSSWLTASSLISSKKVNILTLPALPLAPLCESSLERSARWMAFALQVVVGWLLFSPLLVGAILMFLVCAWMVRRLEALFGVDRAGVRRARKLARQLAQQTAALPAEPL